MERWVLFAIISMLFAGFTSVIAKQGLAGISGELGVTVRTLFVCLFVFGFAALCVPRSQFGLLTRSNLVWIGLSAATTTVSWIFYYKALAEGDVATVALIDKGSFVVAVVAAWTLLGEPITARTVIGATVILAGIAIVSWR